MRATSDFQVTAFRPTLLEPAPAVITTGLPTGVAVIDKEFDGEVSGRSTTVFVSAFDAERGAGTYVAMESFEGSLHGRTGTFNFVHSASTSGSDRTGEYFSIVPLSGTGELSAITGSGGLRVDEGRHVIWFDYELD